MTGDAATGGTVIAFDFGARRIGVAVGERVGGIASPLTTVARSDSHDAHWSRIQTILAEWRPGVLLVGLPRNAEGVDTAMTRKVRAFAQGLTERTGLPVELVDERLSSAEAASRLADARRSGRRKRRLGRGDIDPVAAQIIIETWMSGRAAGQSGGPSRQES